MLAGARRLAMDELHALMILLGNHLGFDGFDPERDAVWMAELAEESTCRIPCGHAPS
jgi:hypothetical protein